MNTCIGEWVNHTHSPTPSPALPKSSFVWQLVVGVSLSRVVVVVGVDQSLMSHLSHTCKQKYCLQKLIKYTYHKDWSRPVQTSLWLVLDFSKWLWIEDWTAVTVFCGSGISGLFGPGPFSSLVTRLPNTMCCHLHQTLKSWEKKRTHTCHALRWPSLAHM